MEKFKILSLDGGGVRGIITAEILKEVERVTRSLYGQELWQYFDMVAGTSTGSLITVMIAKRMDATAILQKYYEVAAQVFPKQLSETVSEKLINSTSWLPLVGGTFKELFGKIPTVTQQFKNYEYDNKPLIRILKEVLGEETTLETLAPNNKPLVLIPAYNLDQASFVTFNNSPQEGYGGIPVWQACLASAAAPVYLPRVDIAGRAFIDGGVASNNPSLLAMSLALETHSNLTLDDISIVSIGTGRTTKSFTLEEVQNWHPLSWATNVADIFMEPPIEVTECIAHTLMNRTQSGGYLRLNFELNTPGDSEDLKEVVYKNRYTKVKLNERIDLAEEKSLKALECAARAFVKEELVGERLQEFMRGNS